MTASAASSNADRVAEFSGPILRFDAILSFLSRAILYIPGSAARSNLINFKQLAGKRGRELTVAQRLC
jgi:hypothetical protein